MHIQIININGLKYTKKLIADLLKQTWEYELTIIDQASTEPGTNEFLESMEVYPHIDIAKNKKNTNINELWNELYLISHDKYLCFLNNDMRVPSNFVEDTIKILDKEPQIGCVVHATNHPNYCKTTPLKYVITKKRISQGWDFTMRKNVYTLIPEELDMFGGDDYLFSNMYNKNWQVAIALSSPVIHFHAKSRKFYAGNRKKTSEEYAKYGYKNLSHYTKKYSKRNPTFTEIKENG